MDLTQCSRNNSMYFQVKNICILFTFLLAAFKVRTNNDQTLDKGLSPDKWLSITWNEYYN